MSDLTAVFFGVAFAILAIRLGYAVRDITEKYVLSKMKKIDKKDGER